MMKFSEIGVLQMSMIGWATLDCLDDDIPPRSLRHLFLSPS